MRGVRDVELAVDERGRVYGSNGNVKHSSRILQCVIFVKDFIRNLFLPSEYPVSVTEDYLPFQVYDSIQGTCSYARSMLSNQSILLGLGVGAADASLFAASISMATKEAVSIFSSLIICSQSYKFDAYAKQWRLAADVFNDIAMTLDLFSPIAGEKPGGFMLFYILASVCRAITGVCGSSTRIALTQHFALQQNAADVAACESAQETAVTLIGLLFGLGLTRIARDFQMFAFVCFAALTCLHVYANIKAMRCLAITRINTYRLIICFDHYLEHGTIPSPEYVAQAEPLLPRITGIPYLQQSTDEAAIVFTPRLDTIAKNDFEAIQKLIDKVHTATDNIYWVIPSNKRVYVFLHQDCVEGKDMIRAYIEALCVVRSKDVDQLYISRFLDRMQDSNCRWSLDNPLLLQTNSRISAVKDGFDVDDKKND